MTPHIDLALFDGNHAINFALASHPNDNVPAILVSVYRQLAEFRRRFPAASTVIALDTGPSPARAAAHKHYHHTDSERIAIVREHLSDLRDLCDGMGLSLLCEEGFESRDLLAATIRAAPDGSRSVVAGSGKELLALLPLNASIYNPLTDQMADPASLPTLHQIKVEQIHDWLALIGNRNLGLTPSEGLGERSAARLIQEHGNLESALRAVPPGSAAALVGALVEALARKPLFTPLPVPNFPHTLYTLARKQADPSRLRELEERLELQRVGGLRHSKPTAHNEASPPAASDAQAVLTALRSVEGGSLAVHLADHGLASFLELRLSDTAYSIDVRDFETTSKVLRALGQPDRKLVTNNAKSLYKVFQQHGVVPANAVEDVAVKAMLAIPNTKTACLSELCSLASLNAEGLPACEQIALLNAKLDEVINASAALTRTLTVIEQPMAKILANMEVRGMPVSREELEKVYAAALRQSQALARSICREAGEEFNIDSSQQLMNILFNRLNLRLNGKIPTSVSAEILTALGSESNIARDILKYRGFTKTAADALSYLQHTVNGRIHSAISQTSTTTGRLATSEPNLMATPGGAIRSCFRAPAGKVLISADYSQIELRILAHLSGCKRLAQAFRDKRDVHTSTASEVFGARYDAVTDDMRRAAKAINFGLIYGLSSFGLAKKLGVSEHEAQQYINRFFLRHPEILPFLESLKRRAQQHGYVETITGRKIFIPGANSPENSQREHALRAAMNAPMQGTSADIVKLAMVKLTNWSARDKLDAHIVMQVHDEIVAEVDEGIAERFHSGMIFIMENTFRLSVPLVVAGGIAQDWETAKKCVKQPTPIRPTQQASTGMGY